MFKSILITNSPVLILHRTQSVGKHSPGRPTIIMSVALCSCMCLCVCVCIVCVCVVEPVCAGIYGGQRMMLECLPWSFLHLALRDRLSHVSPEPCLLGWIARLSRSSCSHLHSSRGKGTLWEVMPGTLFAIPAEPSPDFKVQLMEL